MKKIIIYILFLTITTQLCLSMAINAQGVRPSYGTFATGNLSKRPNLWKNLVYFSKASLGVTGMNLRDISGGRNHSNLSNMDMTNWVIGKNGYALNLEGVDDFVDLGNPGQLSISGAITIVACVNLNSLAVAESHSIITKQRSTLTNKASYIFTNNNSQLGSLSFNFHSNADGWNGWILNSVFSVGEWIAVAVTYDEASNAKIYVDGIESSSVSRVSGTGFPALPVNTANAVVGANNNSTRDQFMDGRYNYIGVYDRILTPVEIADMHENPNAMFEFRDRPIFAVPTSPPETTQVIIISQLIRKWTGEPTYLYN